MAGSWSCIVGRGTVGGQKFYVIECEFTCDADDGSVPALSAMLLDKLVNGSGGLCSARVLFDGVATPTECNLTVTDEHGIDMLGGAGAGDNKFSASGMINLNTPVLFKSNLYVNVATAAADANAGKKGKVVLYVLP